MRWSATTLQLCMFSASLKETSYGGEARTLEIPIKTIKNPKASKLIFLAKNIWIFAPKIKTLLTESFEKIVVIFIFVMPICTGEWNGRHGSGFWRSRCFDPFLKSPCNLGFFWSESQCVKSHIFVQKIEFWRNIANHLIWIFAPKCNNILEF